MKIARANRLTPYMFMAPAIVIMVIFSLFVQAAEGSTYGIVPYVDPPATGSISGIVGAGGNTGAVGFGLGFRQLDYKDAFIIMGSTILVSAVLSVFIVIKGHRGILFGKDEDIQPKDTGVLAVPEPDADKGAEVNDMDA